MRLLDGGTYGTNLNSDTAVKRVIGTLSELIVAMGDHGHRVTLFSD